MNQERRPASSMMTAILLALLVSFALNTYLMQKYQPRQQQGHPSLPAAPATPRSIAEAMRTVSMTSTQVAVKEIKTLRAQIPESPQGDAFEDAAWRQFRIAFLQETVLKDTKKAKRSYEVVSKKYARTIYAPTAAFRRAEIVWRESENHEHKEGKKELEHVERIYLVDQTRVQRAPLLSVAWFKGVFSVPPQTLIHYPDGTTKQIMEAVCAYVDPLNQKDPLYRLLNFFVTLLGRNKNFSHAFAIILFGIIVKILLQPLNKASFKSMHEMQKLQPEMKKIQEKYKGDKSDPRKMNQEIMKLYKSHGVNPMGGCLPLLIQMPVLILLYRAIMSYRCEFDGAHFLWVKNLAMPDMPLLILYGISMILSTKLTAMPTADPAQQQQQKIIMWLMPIMFVFICKSFPSAFVLYWMTFNVMQTAQQLLMYRQWDREEGKEVLGGLAGLVRTLNPSHSNKSSNTQTTAAAGSATNTPATTPAAKASQTSARRRRRKKK